MKRIIKSVVCFLLAAVFSAAGMPFAEAKSEYYPTAELLQIKSHIEKDADMGIYATVQGGCTDGKYAYFACQNGDTVILKYDLKTWKLKKKSTVAGLGHANDMTYNSKEKYIVIANNYSYNDILTLLDPDTLKVVGTVEPKKEKTEKEIKNEAKKLDIDEDEVEKYKRIKVYSIAYNAKREQYVAGISGTYDFAILDEDFEVVEQFEGVPTGYTRQGCDCDDEHIYFTQSGGSNAIVIYDYDGEQLDMISLGHSHEVENIFHIGKSFYTTLHYYGNSVHRVGISDDTQIRFNIHYDPGSGQGVMEDTSVHYGEDKKLRKCSFEKPGYFFGGWQIKRDSDDKTMGYRSGSDEREWLGPEELYNIRLYKDEATVARLVKFGTAELTAFWINENYGVYFDSDGGDGWMAPAVTAYGEEYTLPKNEFVKIGYVFSGYTASRDADGRVFGYRKDSDEAEWLRPEDAFKEYLFGEGDKVKKLTYDGAVTFTAQFTFAYVFDESYETLLKYVGVDTKADIPNVEGKLKTIASSAFENNDTVTELFIPDTVENIEAGAVSGCSKLEAVYFEENYPKDMDNMAVKDSGTPMAFEIKDGEPLCLGFYADRYCAPIIRCNAKAFERKYAEFLGGKTKNNSL